MSLQPSRTRVPDPTPDFWLAKAASTALGEALSDFSIHVLPPVTAVLLGFAFFAGALTLQLTRRRYLPAPYWLAVAAVGVFGTMAADVMHVVLGLPYAVSAALWSVVLAAVFIVWWRTERTLSVHEVTTTRRELYYWSAVVATFALGTAVGDFTAIGLGIGYLASILLFAVLILIPAAGCRWWRFPPVFAFWFAYVLTRPLGASVADWLGKPVSDGGMGIGSGVVSLAFALVMVVVALMQVRSARPRSVGMLADEASSEPA